MECKVSDLVKRGHDQAVELKSSCGAVDVRDVAQLISDLATQLDVQLARSNALAAENAGLKAKGREVLKEAAYVYSRYNRMVDHLDGESVDGQTLHEFQEVIEKGTPATDAFLAEVRAQGVEMFAAYCGEENSVFVEAKAYYRSLPDAAYEFAAQLRKGVQS